MFQIRDGRDTFYQYDLNRQLIVNDNSINQVHFCNRTDDYSLVVNVREEDGVFVADVPNILLQESWGIKVYGYDKEYTKHCKYFKVVARSQPSDYLYEETDVITLDNLEKRLTEIEEKGISQEAIASGIDEYFEKNPIEIPSVDLSGYATVDYVNNAVGNIEIPTVDLSDYAKKTDIPTKVSELNNDVGYLTQHQDLSAYALKSEIPDVSGFANKSEIPDVSGYLTADDVSGFQTAEDVNALIDVALSEIGVAEVGEY